jgi:hypothetical protein
MRKAGVKAYLIGVNHGSKRDGEKILEYGMKIRPDAIFIERAEGMWHLKPKEWAIVILRNPLFLLGMGISRYFERIRTGKHVHYDEIYAKKTSEKLQIPFHKIDDNIYQMIASRRIGWALPSWGLVALFFVGLMKIVSLNLGWDTTLIYCLFYGSLVPLLFLLIFARLGVPTRNRHMIERIEKVLKTGTYSKIFLITGKRHVGDFRKRMSDKYDVVSIN